MAQQEACTALAPLARPWLEQLVAPPQASRESGVATARRASTRPSTESCASLFTPFTLSQSPEARNYPDGWVGGGEAAGLGTGTGGFPAASDPQ